MGPAVLAVGKLITAYTTITPLIAAATGAKTLAASASAGLAVAEGTATGATYGLAGAVNVLVASLGPLLIALAALVAIKTVRDRFDVGSVFGIGQGTTSPLIDLGGHHGGVYSGPTTTWTGANGQ